MNKSFLAFFLVVMSVNVSAQVLPKEGSSLNYRLIGISFPEEKNGKNYVIEIASGNHKVVDSFKKHMIDSVKTTSSKLMVEVPAFGEEYSWRVVSIAGVRKKESPIYHFSTRANDRVDTTKYRLRVLQPSNSYPDKYVSIDGGGVIYDFKGSAVAYIPEVNGLTGFVADWKFTEEGTMTFNFGKDGVETNLNGDILWKTPELNPVNGGIFPEKHHHAFFKMSNGHYMTLGMEYFPVKEVTANDSKHIVISNEKTIASGFKLGSFGTIIEFDKDGKVVWSWKDTEHLIGSDFDYFPSPVDSNWRFDPHCNSLFLDEQNDFVYLSYRNLNRISKIDHKTGRVVDVYGENFKPGSSSKGYDFFCNPHGVRRSADGYLYFFNNNSCWNTDSLPTIVMLKEPDQKSDSLKKVWEFKCTVEGDYSKKFGAGGSAVQMKDGSMFVCMGNAYSKLFIVKPDKRVTWSALPERHVETDNIWVNVKQYKANILNRSLLESLIWEAEKNIRVKE
jgi:hypothetical protein